MYILGMQVINIWFVLSMQIMKWMEYRQITFSTTDFALYLDLVSLTDGMAAAESYFNGLPPRAQNRFTYGVLLNCYCRNLMEDKALAFFETMNQLNYVTSDLPFNNLMCLYMRLGKPGKVPLLIDEMKQTMNKLDNFLGITSHAG